MGRGSYTMQVLTAGYHVATGGRTHDKSEIWNDDVVDGVLHAFIINQDN